MAILLKWFIILLAMLNFSYMAIDGSRALVKGDYMRPSQGAYAGQLGPWSQLVKSYGIEPESTTMKTIFVVWGICGIVITVCFAVGLTWAWKAILLFNVLSLWYLFVGTACSSLQILLLIVLRYFK